MEQYKCMNEQCQTTWEDKIGPVTCKTCGSRYIEWISYKNKTKVIKFDNGLTFEFKERN